MKRITNKRMIGLAVSTAMAASLLNGCATQSAPRADLSASRAEAALAKGKAESAIEHAEAATLAEPRNAAYRVMLGTAYLDAGRFASAATTFDDAMKLGDSSARTVLSRALALDGEGRHQEAAALLRERESQIAPADLGLAYALSGEPGQGIQVLSNAIRRGENSGHTITYWHAVTGTHIAGIWHGKPTRYEVPKTALPSDGGLAVLLQSGPGGTAGPILGAATLGRTGS